MSWAEYAAAARELAELRRGDATAHADRAAQASTAQGDLERLDKHLTAQRSHLTALARTLRLPEPWFGPAERSAVTDLAQALHRAADAANAAETEARRAEETGARPVLLPDLSPATRNGLIYGAWAFVGWLFQCGLVNFTPESNFGVLAWSLCGLPAVAFFAGYFTVATVGQPRVGKGYPKNPRLGGAICFVGMPIAWLALIAFFSFVRA